MGTTPMVKEDFQGSRCESHKIGRVNRPKGAFCPAIAQTPPPLPQGEGRFSGQQGRIAQNLRGESPERSILPYSVFFCAYKKLKPPPPSAPLQNIHTPPRKPCKKRVPPLSKSTTPLQQILNSPLYLTLPFHGQIICYVKK